MKLVKKILFALLIVLIAIQFIQPAHNTSGQAMPMDITKTVSVPDNVLNILKNACYDCHSNNTRYPWYAYIQPMGWLMAWHINNGKDNLNFSDFGSSSKRKQSNKLRTIETSIKEGTMPLSSYTIIHTGAKLSAEDKKLIIDWVSVAKDNLSKN